MIEIRSATSADVPAIQAIYAHHVLTGTGSFELEPPSLEEMGQRMRAVQENDMPYLVAMGSPAGAQGPDGATGSPPQILGYAYANWFRPRLAYRFTVEDSIYISPCAQGQGVGKVLLEALLKTCEERGCRQMVAVIGDSQNLGSIAVHARCGFRYTGILRSSGWKFDRWLDTVFMQKELGSGDRQAP